MIEKYCCDISSLLLRQTCSSYFGDRKLNTTNRSYNLPVGGTLIMDVFLNGGIHPTFEIGKYK
jgi:hypothetical protein